MKKKLGETLNFSPFLTEIIEEREKFLDSLKIVSSPFDIKVKSKLNSVKLNFKKSLLTDQVLKLGCNNKYLQIKFLFEK